MSFMTEGAMLAGIVSFAAAGLMWYLYFYRKEKKLLQRLYDIVEQAEERSIGGYADAGSEFKENDRSVIKYQTRKQQKKSMWEGVENSSEDKNLEHKISEHNSLEHKISEEVIERNISEENVIEHKISEEKVSMIEDKELLINYC